MLILQRVSELMGHHWLLPFQLNPIGQVKLLRLWIVVAGNLLREQLDYKGTVLELCRGQAEFLEGQLRRMHLRGVVCSSRLRTIIRSISVRDWAPLFTGRRMGNSRISLVSFRMVTVAATMAALRGALVAVPVA